MNYKKIHFEILIDANPEKVFDIMLDDAHYRQWTSAFNPTSHFIGSWAKGQKMLFVGIDETGKKGGMVSLIKENIYGKQLSIEHIGLYEDDSEILDGPKVDEWKGSCEEYFFSNVDGKTLLKVQMDSNDEFEDYFNQTWPKALEILKTICES